jgi:ubiquinone/menaquinone biosynthesis C-methylase UbiE
MLTLMHTLEFERPHDYLARLAASDVGRAYKSLVVDEMQIAQGSTVLDLGCGTGADLAAFADAVGHAGRVIGIDSDAEAIARATMLRTDVSVVEVTVGDVHHLPLPDQSVDRVHTDRVMQHVVDPASVVREVARVLRPDGVAAFAEPDWDTLVIAFPDPAVPAAYRRFITDRAVRNARIGRQVPDLCERQGLHGTRVIPVTAVYRDAVEADRVFGFHRVTSRAVKAGYLSAADGAAWLHHLSTGRFFASVSLFVTLSQKPAS